MNVALITGASSGLGKEFVRELSTNKEIDEFWCIARRKERLEELQKYTSKKVIPLCLDLSKDESYEFLSTKLNEENPNITYLISCAGLGKVGETKEVSLENQMNMISINVEASVHVTKLALDYMHEGSHILEIGSIAGFQPMPYFNVYGASKAFIQSYTKSLHYELKRESIKVTLVCPYWIKDTEFISIAKINKGRYSHYPLATTKEKVVKRALRANNMNLAVCTPDIVSTLDRVFSKCIPHALYTYIIDLFSKI